MIDRNELKNQIDGLTGKQSPTVNSISAKIQEAVQEIEAILKRGNNAEIRRKGNGYIILEIKKTIRYEATEKNATNSQGM